MSDDSRHKAKQKFVQDNIVDAGYNLDSFIAYLAADKDNGNDLNSWTYAELITQVDKFRKGFAVGECGKGLEREEKGGERKCEEKKEAARLVEESKERSCAADRSGEKMENAAAVNGNGKKSSIAAKDSDFVLIEKEAVEGDIKEVKDLKKVPKVLQEQVQHTIFVGHKQRFADNQHKEACR